MRPLILLLMLAGCTKTSYSPIIAELVKDQPASVFVFLASDCPLSQGYTLTLNSLQSQFKDFRFYAVFVGDPFDSTYKVDFPYVSDRDLKIADFLGATKTPEVFAVDSRGAVFYKGAIDNWAPELGQHRTVVTEHYLLDALNSFKEQKAIRIKQTEAVGCFIERKN